MRINDHQLVQLIEHEDPLEHALVFIEQDSGKEIVIPRCDWDRLSACLAYLTSYAPDGRVAG